MSRHIFSHPQDSRVPSHIMVTWGDICHHTKHSLFSFFFLPLYILGMLSYDLEYPSDQFEFPILAVSPPSLSCNPNFLTSVAVWKAEKTFSSITKTSLYYELCLQHKSKAQTLADTGKNVNSDPDKTTTCSYNNQSTHRAKVIRIAISVERYLSKIPLKLRETLTSFKSVCFSSQKRAGHPKSVEMRVGTIRPGLQIRLTLRSLRGVTQRRWHSLLWSQED